ncbi:outer membrane protein [Rhizobium sp. Root1220]|uniref:outer membrane protein n=1 Tax=Rhizobium sp. Root1220 TaxID=1736432 RepID=UPI0006F4DE36|nr:outer membrane protein [Rhizobium sp. Root1220]KQV66054.1 heat resistant agglutinin 1 protein [Rhizobium sp. Root1220]
MKSSTVILAAATSLALFGGAAMAEERPITEAPEVTISGDSSATGWYLRGDLGYAPGTGNETPTYLFNEAGGAASGGEFDPARFSKPFSGGAGVGYQFTDIWRADLTADFFKSDFTGTARTDLPCAASAAAGTGCTSGARADLRAYGIMANGYADLATIAGLTPYVGAGIGVSNVRWGNVRSQPECVDGASTCSGATFSQQNFNGESSWRFTYALMAGLSYEVTDNLKIDFGYRFSDIAGGRMFSGSPGTSGRDDGLTRHEIRIGLRIGGW